MNTRNSTKRRLRRRLVEFMMFNLLTVVWLELGLLDLLGLLVGRLVLLKTRQNITTKEITFPFKNQAKTISF